MTSSNTMTTAEPKFTIWIWPSGVFPRRVIYYFRAKGITLSALEEHNVHLIPVNMDKTTKKLKVKEEFEERPEGSSLPCMRIEHGGEKEAEYVHETLAILQVLEEVFEAYNGKEGKWNMMGNDLSQRARTNDILSLLLDANVWAAIALMHSNPKTLFWSGLTEFSMSASAAADAQGRVDRLMSKLEEWVERDVIYGRVQSLSGKGASVTLVDIMLVSSVNYAEESYGYDFIQDHGVLRTWCERIQGAKWWISGKELEECEEEGWQIVLDE